jgi:hypothetical protein
MIRAKAQWGKRIREVSSETKVIRKSEFSE